MSVDRESFRAGMRRLAAGVCVISTASHDGKRYGLTATAVCSVSADPPTLLACVNSATSTCAAIQAGQRFAVNLLSEQDRNVAHRFASPIPPEERFSEGLWETIATGAPVLKSAVAGFDCTVSQVFEVATHRILIGDIQAIRCREPQVKPLLYAAGSYGGFATSEAANNALLKLVTGRSSADLQFLEDGLHWGLF